jgi:hypothetical protein
VSCHDPFELDTATKLCKPKEGVTDKEGDSLIEGDGMDTFTGYPTPTIGMSIYLYYITNRGV